MQIFLAIQFLKKTKIEPEKANLATLVRWPSTKFLLLLLTGTLVNLD